MFKSGGIKVYPEEVEENLKKHPDILDAVVFAIPQEVIGFVPMACIRNKKPLIPGDAATQEQKLAVRD